MKWTWITGSDSEDPAHQSMRADKRILLSIERGLGQWQGESHPTGISRSQLQRLIEEGRVLADGAPLRANQKLPEGCRIEVTVPEPKPLELVPEERELDILFEDDHLLVVNKPPGLTVHPSETQSEGTLVHALLHHIKDLSGIGGVLRPGIVHRIDKDTSGALVITKTDRAHQGLAEVFSRHEIERQYWAICYGSPAALRSGGGDELKIDTLIGRNPADRKKMSVQSKEGRRAITYVSKIEEYALPGHRPFASLLSARLETGRTHQVRVHLTNLGHSLLGDPVYGTPSERQHKWLALPRDVRDAVRMLPGQALHARVLGFKHPVTGEKLRFEAEPPEAFRLLLETLRRYL